MFSFFVIMNLGDIMPELPEVETVKNTLKKYVLGKKIIGVDYNKSNIADANKNKELNNCNNI